MSTFTERKELARRIAQELAQGHVFDHLPTRENGKQNLHAGVLYGLTVGAAIIGLEPPQLRAIEEHAHDWAAENCPGLQVEPKACIAGCPSPCRFVPLPADTWR